MTDIKAVIFDMGGVFIRTRDNHARQELAEQYGKTVEELSQILFLSPLSIKAEVGLLTREELFPQLMPLIGAPVEKTFEFVEKFFSGDEEDKELVAYARSLRPHYKLGLLSNAFPGTRAWMQERHTFLSVFDVSYFSAEVGLRKPDPRFFQLILDDLGVKAGEALFVDDFEENIIGAQEMGIRTVWFKEPVAAFAELKRTLPLPG